MTLGHFEERVSGSLAYMRTNGAARDIDSWKDRCQRCSHGFVRGKVAFWKWKEMRCLWIPHSHKGGCIPRLSAGVGTGEMGLALPTETGRQRVEGQVSDQGEDHV